MQGTSTCITHTHTHTHTHTPRRYVGRLTHPGGPKVDAVGRVAWQCSLEHGSRQWIEVVRDNPQIFLVAFLFLLPCVHL